MKNGAWHVYKAKGAGGDYAAVWVADDADPDCTREQYLDGMYIHRHDAQHLADAANKLVGYDPSGERSRALRDIVEALR